MNIYNMTLESENSERSHMFSQNSTLLTYTVPPFGSANWTVNVNYHGSEETLYLMSIPGMVESILEGGSIPIEECIEDPGF